MWAQRTDRGKNPDGALSVFRIAVIRLAVKGKMSSLESMSGPLIWVRDLAKATRANALAFTVDVAAHRGAQ